MGEPEPRDLLDEQKCQHSADMQVLISIVGGLRLELAKVKAQYYAARAGVPGVGHPKEFLAQIAQKRREVDVFQRMIAGIFDGDVLPEPEQEPVQLAR